MLTEIPRPEFLARKLDIQPGESIGLYGNTGSGKTYLAYQIAQVFLDQNPGLRFTAFQPKPADNTTLDYARILGLEVTAYWPPRKRIFHPSPRGYVHWPAHITSSAEADIEHLSREFNDSLNAEYWKGNVLAYVDDEFLMSGKYKCAATLDQYLVAGRSNHAGLMFALQAPKGTVRNSVSSFHHSQPVHMFFNRENVESNREKYAEIACGIDPHAIEEIVKNLRTFRLGDGNVSETLYIDRRGPYSCVIRPWLHIAIPAAGS